MKEVDRKIDSVWNSLKSLHSNESVNISLPLFEEIILNHLDKEAIEMEVKNAIMHWYWNGYYKGFMDGKSYGGQETSEDSETKK